MSERSTLHWLMGRADDISVMRACLQQAAPVDSVLLLGEAVLLALHPAFENCAGQQHMVICEQHWWQCTSVAVPATVELMAWPQIVALIRQHPLQRSWT